jgi:hypothetical protein
MPIEEIKPKPAYTPPAYQLGQEVIDKDGNRLGKIRARFSHYVLVERGGLFVKAYYIPHNAISKNTRGILHLALTEEELRRQGFNRVPDDLYEEAPELGPSDLSGVAQFARGPLSPAETGHYNFGRHWPGINTDASGSYHREEVLPVPQKYVGESTEIFTTEEPIEPRDISSN